MLRESLLRIMREYPSASTQSFAQHPLAAHLRATAVDDVSAALGVAGHGAKVQGSAGAGNWANVPWISIFDLAVTDSATRGYYVVYLFHSSKPLVHLSLNQGTTSVREEHGRASRSVMRVRAQLMRNRIPEYQERFAVQTIDLGATETLPADYEAAHALGVSYHAESMPDEHALVSDLRALITAYRTLAFRGGLSPGFDNEDLVEEGLEYEPRSLFERRRYRMHMRIERNSAASKLAKRTHGLRCQGCGLSFEDVYGQLGCGFIEVHHLRPLAALEEGEAIRYDVATDFAVLCANCHRMIHRQADPADLIGLRARVKLAPPGL